MGYDIPTDHHGSLPKEKVINYICYKCDQPITSNSCFLVKEDNRVRHDDCTPHLHKNDPINPTHYKSHPSGVECITITRHMTSNIANVIKYCWRNGLKNGSPSIEDLKKAAWYLNDEIQMREKEI